MKHDTEQHWRLSYPGWVKLAAATGRANLEKAKFSKAVVMTMQRSLPPVSAETHIESDTVGPAAATQTGKKLRLEVSAHAPPASRDVRAEEIPDRALKPGVVQAQLRADRAGGRGAASVMQDGATLAKLVKPDQTGVTSAVTRAVVPVVMTRHAPRERQPVTAGDVPSGLLALEQNLARHSAKTFMVARTGVKPSSGVSYSGASTSRSPLAESRPLGTISDMTSVPPTPAVRSRTFIGTESKAPQHQHISTAPPMADAAEQERRSGHSSQGATTESSREASVNPTSAGFPGPIGGDVYLDGTLMGRWVARTITAVALRQPSSGSTFDPTRTRLPTGTMIGI